MDKNDSKMEAINDIYRVLRPGEPPSFEVANEIDLLQTTNKNNALYLP